MNIHLVRGYIPIISPPCLIPSLSSQAEGTWSWQTLQPSTDHVTWPELHWQHLAWGTEALRIYLFFYLSIYLSIHPSILSIYLSISLSFFLSYLSTIYLSIYISIYISIYLSIYPSIYLSIDRSIYLSICVCGFVMVLLKIGYIFSFHPLAYHPFPHENGELGAGSRFPDKPRYIGI
jgi:hypothetical protein